MHDLEKIKILIDQGILQNCKQITHDGELNSLCPFHQEKNASFSINVNTGKFNCFSCGEGGRDFMSFFEKIKEHYGIEFKEDLQSRMQSVNYYIQNLFVETKEDRQHLKISEKISSMYRDPLGDYMKERIKDENVRNLFEIGYNKIQNKYFIPIRDQHKQLVGYALRQFIEPKYWYNPGLKKKLVLFGIDKIKGNTGIITEGPLDVIKSYDNGFSNCVGILGSKMSEEQEKLILRYFDKLVIATDNDKAGNPCAKDIYNRLRKKIKVKRFKWVTGKKDLGELSKEEMEKEMSSII